MNAEIVVATMLSASSITNLVGNRKALSQLPQNTTFPALVYQVINNTPDPMLDYANSPQLARSRVQFNPLAATIGELKSIHSALRTVFDFQHNIVVGGVTVMSCRLDFMGVVEKDNDAGIWTQPADYLLTYYET